MRPGATTRNLIVAAGYVVLLPVLLSIVLIALPFAAAYAAGRNRHDVAERLDSLPGISSSGGAVAGVATFVYVLVAMGALIAVLPGTNQMVPSTTDSSLTDDDGPNASSSGGMTAVSPTPTGTAPPPTDRPGQRDDGESGAADRTGATAIPTPTATPRPRERAGERTATVRRVVDGDTLKVRLDNGTEDTVRLLGVDTPEVHAENTPDEWEGVPNSEAGKDCLRQEGHAASDWVKRQLADETVRLVFDENEGKRGYYGRLLAYVYVDGQHINYQLVQRGNARVYDSSFEKRSSFYAAERDAQSQESGAWQCRNVEANQPTPTPTPTSSGDGGNLVVEEVHADAPGNDHENENGEYVVFKNTGDGALDLSGWMVSDEADHEYFVPRGFTLDPGATVTLYTGSGDDPEDELYWGSDLAIWNNDGDTIYVETDDGTQVIAHEY